MTFKVKYQAADYSGVRTVNAEDEDHAIAKVRAWVRKQMSLPMYYESYKVVEAETCEKCGERSPDGLRCSTCADC